MATGYHRQLSYLKELRMRLSRQTSSMSTLRFLIACSWSPRSLAAHSDIETVTPFDSEHFAVYVDDLYGMFGSLKSARSRQSLNI